MLALEQGLGFNVALTLTAIMFQGEQALKVKVDTIVTYGKQNYSCQITLFNCAKCMSITQTKKLCEL